MIRRPPRSTPFPTRRSSDLAQQSADLAADDQRLPAAGARAVSEILFCLLVSQPCAGLCGHYDADRVILNGIRNGNRERDRSEEHTSELQSQSNPVCRLLLET